MGAALRRTAFSPNIKERRDYSCAVFDATGRVIAQGDHMPVHLGSMPMAVAAALREVEIGPGDVVALNDPFAGGTHLPDVTLVMGVFAQASGRGSEGRGQKGKQKAAARLPLSPCPTDPCFSTLPIARITPTSAGRRRVRWVWRQMFMAKACAFRRCEL